MRSKSSVHSLALQFVFTGNPLADESIGLSPLGFSLADESIGLSPLGFSRLVSLGTRKVEFTES